MWSDAYTNSGAIARGVNKEKRRWGFEDPAASPIIRQA
jgi:hypothetical protein